MTTHPLLILEKIKRKIANCSECTLNIPPYNSGNSVPGLGSPTPRLLLVGEAPGEQESRVGKPFVGRSGQQVLQPLLIEVGITLEDIFITNVQKHRPPNNRNPSEEEITSCLPFLFQQITVLKPQRILALGKIAAYALARNSAQLPSYGLRGKTFTLHLHCRDIPVDITWHPSYILRNPDKRQELLNDIKVSFNKTKRSHNDYSTF